MERVGSIYSSKLVASVETREEAQMGIIKVLWLGTYTHGKFVLREKAKENVQKGFYFNCPNNYGMRGWYPEDGPKIALASFKM